MYFRGVVVVAVAAGAVVAVVAVAGGCWARNVELRPDLGASKRYLKFY